MLKRQTEKSSTNYKGKGKQTLQIQLHTEKELRLDKVIKRIIG